MGSRPAGPPRARIRRGRRRRRSRRAARPAGYLDQPGAASVADEVSYRPFVVWPTSQERSRLIAELGRTVLALKGNTPDVTRAPHILSTVFFPAKRGPADGA